MGARLDKFFVPHNITDVCSAFEISPCSFSDHDFVHLHFSLGCARALEIQQLLAFGFSFLRLCVGPYY